MAESDFRDPAARRHGGNHRNARRGVHSDGNSHVPAPARKDGKHNQHEEENTHEERTTKMTKRMKRILTSAALLIFAFSTADQAFAERTRGFDNDNDRVNVRVQDFNADFVRFNRGDLRLNDAKLRDGSWDVRYGVRYDRIGRDNYRADGRGWRISDNYSLRTRDDGWLGENLRQRKGFYFGRDGRAEWTIRGDRDGKVDFRSFRARRFKDNKDDFQVRLVDGFRVRSADDSDIDGRVDTRFDGRVDNRLDGRVDNRLDGRIDNRLDSFID